MIAKTRVRGWSRALRTALLIALLLPPAAGASQEPVAGADPELEWPPEMVRALRSFFERVDVEEVTEGLRPPREEVERLRPGALAATLPRDLRAPWAAVRHGVGAVPYAGSVRGAAGTLSAGGGNSLDRALLLASLYRAAGRRVRLVEGALGWQDAARLVGLPEGAVGGDPWLLWMETVADHWWLEVREDGDWVPVDPSAGSRPGVEVGRRRGAREAPPAELVARAEIELLRGTERLVGVTLPVAALLGEGITVRAQRRVPAVDGAVGGEATGVALPVEPVDPDRVEQRPEVGPEDRDSEQPAEGEDVGDPLSRRVPRIPPGPVVLELRAADRTERTGPVSRPRLAGVRLRVRVRAPMAPVSEIEIPFGPRPDARIAVVLAGGPVSRARLAAAVTPLWRRLGTLAAAEADSRVAFRARPRPEGPEVGEQAGSAAKVAPEIDLAAPEGEEEEVDETLHPVDALRLETAMAWLEFDARAPRALALALLSGDDQLQATSRTVRPDVRIAAVHWEPPAVESEGRFTVWIRDPVVMAAPAERIPRLQAAHGLLQSAMWGQVLNGFADRAPVTAFDVTLRSVGRGRRLAWWTPGQLAPEAWPEQARRRIDAALGTGRAVAAPTDPVMEAGRPLLGWWEVPPGLGTVRGWVAAPAGMAQASVAFGESRSMGSLETLLASLPELHAALRWLVITADAESGVLPSLRTGTCAAAALVGDLLDAGAPPGWPGADFPAFCY